MYTRKEMKERARRTVFSHYGILLTVCLIAIILGSDFTGSFDFFKIPGKTSTREELGRYELTESEFGIDRGNVWDIAYSIIDGSIDNEEKAADEIASEAVKKSEDETNEVLGRSDGVLANLVNGLSSGLFFRQSSQSFSRFGNLKGCCGNYRGVSCDNAFSCLLVSR